MALTVLFNLLALFFLTPFALPPAAGNGDEPPAEQDRDARDEGDVIKLNTRLVNLNVKVADPSGRSIPRLRREDFHVFENGVEQEVAYFEPADAPVNLVLLLDLSGSIGSKIDLVKKAAKRFVEGLHRDDRIAIATFTIRFRLVSGFTSDRDVLRERIENMKRPGGDTAFYDAAWSAFDLLAEVREARKALVILTDGVDSAEIPNEEGSDRAFSELIRRAAEEDVTVFPIYFDTEEEVLGGDYTPRVFALARRQLEALADRTGGAYFKVSDGDNLDGVYRRVADELRALYSLGYLAKDARRDGQWREIVVRVNREKATVRTRRGYYAK